jgi:hypothetical protein
VDGKTQACLEYDHQTGQLLSLSQVFRVVWTLQELGVNAGTGQANKFGSNFGATIR